MASFPGNGVTKYISLGERKRSYLIFDGEKRPYTFRMQIIHLVTPWLKNPVVTPQFQEVIFSDGIHLGSEVFAFTRSLIASLLPKLTLHSHMNKQKYANMHFIY
jgi:hypothetical protein